MWKWNGRELTARSVGTAEEPTEEHPIGEVPGSTTIPGEYMSLHTYLANRYADMVVLTFSQLEELLGFALPDSARTQQEWWTSTDRNTSSCADAWILAGRTATPNLLARTVTFERPPEWLRDARPLA